MNEAIKKTVLSALHRMINILERDTAQDFEELKKLSDELIEAYLLRDQPYGCAGSIK